MKLQKFFIAAAAIIGLASHAFSQGPSSKGKEFYLVSMRSNGSDLANSYFRLFITADSASTGKVEILGVSFTQNFTVPADGITQVNIPDETMGANSAEVLLADSILKKAIHITSDHDISVYAISHKTYSADAYMGYPVNALGKEYYTMCYNTTTGFASEFAFIATQDSTTVTITPSDSTSSKTRFTYTRKLPKKGDVYMVQGIGTIATNDLTGTYISSDKPIAVFSGHERAVVTTIRPGYYNSRDHLIEQLPPVTTWGTKIPVAIPAPRIDQLSRDTLPYVIRVLASRDSSIIQIDCQTKATINHGKFYEFMTKKPVFIQSNHPILVGLYAPSCSNGTSFNAPGDPFLALIPPAEQFLDQYRFVTVVDPVAYTENYVTITAPDVDDLSIDLDGGTFDRSFFTQIANCPFLTLNVSLGQGPHKIQSNRNFGITVCAFGGADSYGYIGGTGLREILPCDLLFVSAKEKGAGCCHEFELSNSLQANYIYGVEARIITKGFKVRSASGPWPLQKIAKTDSTILWSVPPPGLPLGKINGLVGCFDATVTGECAIEIHWTDAAGNEPCVDTVFITCIPNDTVHACVQLGTPTFRCSSKGSDGTQIYSFTLPVVNNTGLPAQLQLTSPSGKIGQSTSVIPSGSSTMSGLFSDVLPKDSIICFYGNLSRSGYCLCVTSICNLKLPSCNVSDTCLTVNKFAITCAGKDTAGNQEYSFTVEVMNNSTITGPLVIKTSNGKVLSSPAIVTAGKRTVNGTFTDIPPKDSVICLNFEFASVCTDNICNIHLPKCVPSGVGERSHREEELQLGASYPDPSTKQTTIPFTLRQAESDVTVVLTDVLGTQVKRIISGEAMTAGGHLALVDVSTLPPGMYFYTLRTGTSTITRSLRVVR